MSNGRLRWLWSRSLAIQRHSAFSGPVVSRRSINTSGMPSTGRTISWQSVHLRLSQPLYVLALAAVGERIVAAFRFRANRVGCGLVRLIAAFCCAFSRTYPYRADRFAWH